jgi:DNA-damage-inducible protein J
MSTADTYVRARIDTQTKERATAALDAMGLSVSDAIRLLLRRVAEERRLPFEVKVPSTRPGPAQTSPAQTSLPLTNPAQSHSSSGPPAEPVSGAAGPERRAADGDRYLDLIAPAPRRGKGAGGDSDRFADLAALMADLKPAPPEGE